jgi:hypothetical protein
MNLIETIVCYIRWLVVTVWSYGLDALELVLGVLINAANSALAILPNAAMESPTLESGLVAQLNYFLPFGPLLAEFGIVMVAWIFYRLYQYLLRWAKADY